MNYIELNVSVEPKEEGSDVLIAGLAELNFESFVESPAGFLAYIPEDQYQKELVEQFFQEFSEVFLIRYESKTIVQQNWNKEWESSFQPIEVDGKCLIRAPFHEAQAGFDLDIIIEPKMSFGTGHHHTTQLMIRRLLGMDLQKRSLLDMGCGTGVLAIVAAKMGADPIEAIDIDQWSYENTVENLERNNINNTLVNKGDAQILEGKKFQVILANINKNVLLNDLTRYAQVLENHGDLLLSGFFETDIPELKAEAEKQGLILEGKLLSEQWTLLHFKTNS